MPIPTTLSALSLLLLSPSAPQQEPSPAAEEFAAVRSVLTEHCLRCHGGEHRKSELSFANADTFHEGGSRGPVIDGDDGKKSRLLEVIEYGNPELAMPKSGAMPDEDVAILRDWILAGAAWPAGEDGQLADPAQHPLEDHRVEADASWWAYGPLAQEPAPPVADERWSQHPVDAWIYSGVEEANQPHGTQASPGVLLRRATFSLTGLPPTPSERQAFAAAIEAHGWDTA